MKYQRILVSLNESEIGAQVFEQAVTLGTALQAQLHLVHILPIQDVISSAPSTIMGELSELGDYPVYADSNLWEIQMQSRSERAQQWLRTYEEQAQQAQLKVEVSCLSGDPGPSICELAQEWQADLILIGRRGLTGLAEAFMGSVSNHVVHHAPCPVLIVQGYQATDSTEHDK